MLLLGLLEVPTWLVLVVAIVLLFYLYTARKHSLFVRYGIPAIQPTPFIGGFKYLAKKGVMQSEYEATMQYGKVVGFFFGNLPTVFLTEPDIIREIFIKRYPEFHSRSQAAGSTKFWERTILLTTDLPYWKFLRTTMSPTFTSGKLRKMEQIVIDGIDRTLDNLKDRLSLEKDGVIDMVHVFRNLTMEIICQAALGVEIESDSSLELKKQVATLLNFSLEKNPMLTLLFLIPDIKKLYLLLDIDYNDTKSIKYIEKSLQEVIKVRKEEKERQKQDILQVMINTNKESKDHDEGENAEEKSDDKPSRGMTDEEIIANAMMFLFAGYDTTSTALIFTAYFLAVHEDYQELIVNEIKEKIGENDPTYDSVQALTQLEMFISESMRIYPPVTRINRQITHPVSVDKYNFPPNISISVPIFTLHRLPEFWPEPEKFDPGRFSTEKKPKIQPYTYLPFGVGPKACLGMRFAYMEMKLTLVKLLQNYKIRPSSGLQIPPKLERHVFCKPVGGMKLILESRK